MACDHPVFFEVPLKQSKAMTHLFGETEVLHSYDHPAGLDLK